MGNQSKIEWTDATWNPWQGCTKVSPGCAFCYMYIAKKRYGQDPSVVVRSKSFNAPLRWRRPRRIFTCSWSDWFHEAADAWRDEAWEVVRRSPQHTFQILTKRPERIANHLPADWPIDNVWLGVSVEGQDHVGRIAELQKIPAKVRFLSIEPLLAPVALTTDMLSGIGWTIVGGESGHRARPMNSLWVKPILEACWKNSVPFFFKQFGRLANNPDINDPTAKENGGTAKGGRILLGQTWNEMPL